MSKKILLYSLFVTIIYLNGCSPIPRNFKDEVLDDMYPILTEEQYQKIESINNKNELSEYLDLFWKNIDSEKINISKSEYLKRLSYANAHYRDYRGWGRSDRKRIYLLNGPPTFIDREEFCEVTISQYTSVKSIEIWVYMDRGRNNNFQSQGDSVYEGMKKFIFADLYGAGLYTLLYSSEEEGNIDVRLLH